MTKEKLGELARLLDAIEGYSERADILQAAVDDAEEGATVTIEIHTHRTIARLCVNPNEDFFNSVLKMMKDLTAQVKIYADEQERRFETLAKSEEAEK